VGVRRVLSRAKFALALLLAGCAHGVAAHPLDPLSAGEIAAAVAALRAAGDSDATTRFALIDLAEPDKAAVLAWRPGDPAPRRAFIVARQRRTVYEGIVDLARRRVERWRAVPRAQSAILPSEWRAAQRITTADPGWRRAMRRRGYDPATAKVFCAPLAAGYVRGRGERGRRLVRVTCYDTAGGANPWARPIEGIEALVDLDAERVLRLADSGAVPPSRDPGRLDEAAQPALRPALKPVVNEAPAGPNFTVDGNLVRWNKWSFRYRLDPRSGLVVSLVRYDDNGRERLVLYQGSLAELFVPYMDPAPGWASRAFLDEGEWGFGPLSLPLTAGSDCPPGARFLDATLADEGGKAVERKGVICLFERNTAAPLWRHAEIADNTYQGRPAVELVMRTIPSAGNYDYVVDWVLTEAGAIRIDVGATGIDEVKGVRAQSMADPSAARDTRYGPLVAPGLVGVDHDHFLSLRLDLDIDGAANTLLERRLVPLAARGGGGRRLWRAVDTPVAREGPLYPVAPGGAETWRVVNPERTNRLGQHPGYELRPDASVTALGLPPRRAGFAAAPLWVTRYDPAELYAAGRYPNQSPGGGGLPAYVAQHRRVADADLVLWYTMGFHHVPRPEDWPVLATMWHSLALVPDGFFDRNPALDVRREFAPAPAGK